MTSRQVLVAASQSRMALSQPELASAPPSGRHATPYTLQPCPRNTPRGAPPPRLSTCQSLTALSEPALASREPPPCPGRSEERRVGKECSSRWWRHTTADSYRHQ